MKIYILFLILFFNLSFTPNTLFAQGENPNETLVRNELVKRGLSEEEVISALVKNGIDINNLENATIDEIIQIQKIIENLEKEKKDLLFNKEPEVLIQGQDTLKEEINNLEKEDFVSQDTIETKSILYGHNILNSPPTRKESLININQNYILGSGDILSVSVWSDNSQFDNNYLIDNDGYIKIVTRGLRKRIFLKGLTFSKSKEKISNILSKYIRFNQGEINISLQTSRNIKISVYGEVTNPSSFDVNATNTVFEGIKYAGRVSDIASVRNIKIISPSGKTKLFDLYKYMTNPKVTSDFYLNNNDLIHIPVAERIVKIGGAVNRPFTFELKELEGLKDLISYAGGFSRDAIKEKIQVVRFVDNKQVYIDIDYFDENGKLNEFNLENGDNIFVRKITAQIENYFTVNGNVYNSGKFSIKPGKRVSDAILEVGLMPDTKTDFAILLRKNEDGTSRYISLNINSILKNIGNNNIDIFLKNKDSITIWSKDRYVDEISISIVGAVRDPGEYLYGTVKSINVLDALLLAGGVTNSASDIAFIHRENPKGKFKKQYIEINLKEIKLNSNHPDNVVLLPYDKLEVFDENMYYQETFVTISGAVNNPSSIQYGEKMTLKDLIELAGGFKLAASTNNIEVSRIEIRNNKPTKVTVAKISVDRDFKSLDSDNGNYLLEPYDNVFVRYIPEFELQKIITLQGEVKYPGDYTITSKNEKVSDLIRRAGGITEEAFVEGATLYRNSDDIGFIVLQLDDALDYQRSKYNYILKGGDIISIPKQRDFITIKGAIKAHEIYKDEVAFNKNGVNVPFHKGKRAMYYIVNYAGGLNDNGSRSEIFVEYPNGEIGKTFNYGLFNLYPKVRKGSIITVGFKEKPSKEGKKEKEVDWNKIITDSVAQISTIMTLVILFKSISQ